MDGHTIAGSFQTLPTGLPRRQFARIIPPDYPQGFRPAFFTGNFATPEDILCPLV